MMSQKRDFYAHLVEARGSLLETLEDMVDHHEGAVLWERLTRPPCRLRYADELVRARTFSLARAAPGVGRVIE